MRDSPIITGKAHAEPSVFRPENLLLEARRQKGLPELRLPRVCVLDPDGDLVRHLKGEGRAQLDPGWACYHTQLHRFEEDGFEFGVVGCAVDTLAVIAAATRSLL